MWRSIDEQFLSLKRYRERLVDPLWEKLTNQGQMNVDVTDIDTNKSREHVTCVVAGVLEKGERMSDTTD